MKILIALSSLIICATINSAKADTLYQCDGIYQNSPCSGKQKSKPLTNLPSVSVYDGKKMISNESVAPAAKEEMRARPRPDMSDVEPEVKIEKPALKPEVKEIIPQQQDLNDLALNSRSFDNLEMLTTRLKTDLDKKSISVADAESQSIRLRVLHDTLCSRQDKIVSVNARSRCDKSEDNIQAITIKVRSALNRG